MEHTGQKVLLATFEEVAKNNGYELFTSEEVISHYKDGMSKNRSNVLSPEGKKELAADLMGLQKAICSDENGNNVICFYRKCQVQCSKDQDNIEKSVYADTSENRFLNRVGQEVLEETTGLFYKSKNRHDFSEKDRKELAKDDEAMPDGSFPIRNIQDLKDAIQSFGRAKDPDAAKLWIKKRAKELGKESLLPEGWDGDKIEKSRAGRYEDTPKNRRLNRVGQEYGSKDTDGDGKDSSGTAPDAERTIKALQAKIDKMKKNKHIFVENGGELRYNKALETLQSKLDSVKGAGDASKGKEVAPNIHSKNYEKYKKQRLEIQKDFEGRYDLERNNYLAEYKLLDEKRDKALESGDKVLFLELGKKITKIQKSESEDLEKIIKKRNEIIDGLDSKFENEKLGSTESSKDSEIFSRVKFEDVPSSGKVNLKKYLSDKTKTSVDKAWEDIAKIETKALKKMEKGLIEDFNKKFDDLPKARKAEKLYAIMKVKAALDKRGKEDK